MVHDAASLGDLDSLQPFRKTFRDVLLQKSFFTDARRIAFHRYGTAHDMRQHRGRHHFVVSGEFALRNPVIREHDLLRMRDHHLLRTTSGAPSAGPTLKSFVIQLLPSFETSLSILRLETPAPPLYKVPVFQSKR